MTEQWDSSAVHPMKPPRCEVAGGELEPIRATPDWKLVSWRYASEYARVPSALRFTFADCDTVCRILLRSPKSRFGRDRVRGHGRPRRSRHSRRIVPAIAFVQSGQSDLYGCGARSDPGRVLDAIDFARSDVNRRHGRRPGSIRDLMSNGTRRKGLRKEGIPPHGGHVSVDIDYLLLLSLPLRKERLHARGGDKGDKNTENGRQYAAVHAEERATLASESQLPSMTDRITGLMGEAGGEKENHSKVEPPAPRVGAPGT